MTQPTKLFVLDTNVLMHDPAALFRFEEHDVYISIAVLEELDAHKKGMSEVARNARQASRFLDEILVSTSSLEAGAALPARPHCVPGRLFIPVAGAENVLPAGFAVGTTDNHLLSLTAELSRRHPDRQVILVSQDINLRIKARTIGLRTEDYTSDQVLDDAELLYTGIGNLTTGGPENIVVRAAAASGEFIIQGNLTGQWFPNQFLISNDPARPALRVRDVSRHQATASAVRDYEHESVWGIRARNREQSFALNLLMDPDIDFVSLLGQAGTGKTLLTLAAALEQTLEQHRYSEIIVTRVTIPVGEDIGFLPGTEEEKMGPWMGALQDNLEVLNLSELETPQNSRWARAAAQDLIRSRLRIKSLNFMRGRTFLHRFIIVDEAQNLTAHQIKTLVTRAGPGTKVVCLGNIAQIDTPYLTETTSGMTYIVDRFKTWAHSGHITLQRGERSRLADHAALIL